MKCMATKSTPIMSVIVCWNCKTRYRRWKTGNIRVDGVTEEKGEMWEDSEKKVLEKVYQNKSKTISK